MMHGLPPPPWRRTLGGGIALVSWAAAPVAHFLTIERPLRHIEGSPATLALAVGTAIAGVLLAWPHRREAEPSAGPHRVGQGVLLALLGLCVLLAALTTALPDHRTASFLLRWFSFPTAIFTLALGFAFVGRLHRLRARQRMANLADLAAFTLPLLWAASQLVGGYPGPPLWGPAALAMLVGAVALAGLLLPDPRPR